MILRCCRCDAADKRLYREAAVFDPKIFCAPCGDRRTDRVQLVPAVRDSADGRMWQLSTIPYLALRQWRALPR